MMMVTGYVLAGVVAGVFGGMLGIGGGIIVVPLLMMLFAAQHIPDALAVPLAIGTSLASIVFTSFSSVRSHNARGSVDWALVRRMAPALVAGAMVGATASSHVPAAVPKIAFLAYCVLAATQMLRGSTCQSGRALPGTAPLSGIGFAVATSSGMLGIGGASIFVPFLTSRSVATCTAIGTASALALPIALAGAVAYVAHGLALGGLPAEALGFVHLPAFAGVALASMLAAPLGVAAAHRLPVATLRKIFAAVLYISAGKIFAAVVGA